MAPTNGKQNGGRTRPKEAQRSVRQRRLLGGGAVAVAALLIVSGIWWWSGAGESAALDPHVQPVSSISENISGNHLHGIGDDSERDRLLLATHYGLFSLENGQLYQIGDSRDDYMRLSMHPDAPEILYTSGHPAHGGNLGVEVSTDGGVSFEQIFQGVDDETVDFHSMAISNANPDTIYGWHGGRLYRSEDGDTSWQAFRPEGLPAEGFCWGAPCLAPDSEQEHRIYAGTAEGLFVSVDRGRSWSDLDSISGPVAGVGVSPHDSGRMFIESAALGLAMSKDGGESFEARSQGLELAADEFVFEIVFDSSDPKRVFIATTGDQVLETTDGGMSWNRILPA